MQEPREPQPKIDWRDLGLAGFGLLVEALALLFGVSILTLAAAALLWAAIRGYRREHHPNVPLTLRFQVVSAALLVLVTTIVPVGAKMYSERQPSKFWNSSDYCKPESNNCGEDTRGYLKPVSIRVQLDPQGHGMYVDLGVCTKNTGRLQVLPGALVINHPEIRAPMTDEEEDEWFNRLGFGGGPASIEPQYKNYWGPSDPPHCTRVSANIPLQSVSDIPKEVDKLRTGGTKVYVASRAIFRDRLGGIISESCSWYEGPNFDQQHLCEGHNGPGKTSG